MAVVSHLASSKSRPPLTFFNESYKWYKMTVTCLEDAAPPLPTFQPPPPHPEPSPIQAFFTPPLQPPLDVVAPRPVARGPVGGTAVLRAKPFKAVIGPLSNVRS